MVARIISSEDKVATLQCLWRSSVLRRAHIVAYACYYCGSSELRWAFEPLSHSAAMNRFRRRKTPTRITKKKYTNAPFPAAAVYCKLSKVTVTCRAHQDHEEEIHRRAVLCGATGSCDAVSAEPYVAVGWCKLLLVPGSYR